MKLLDLKITTINFKMNLIIINNKKKMILKTKINLLKTNNHKLIN